MTSRRLLAVVAIVLIATVGVAGLVTAAPGNTGDAGNYTLAELQQDGRHYSVTGARIVPQEQRVYWLEYRPANQPWRDVSKQSNGPKFGSGMTLKTNTVYLRTIRAQTDTESVNVTVAYWDAATKQVTRGNTTTTMRYAANVSVVHKTVSLGPGWSIASIDLPQHDEPTHVTMWLDAHPETARWTFMHHSVAFTAPIDADTWSEFTMLAGGFIILPALGFGAYGGRKVKSWVERAGQPPGHGFAYYLTIATVATAAILYGLYAFAAEVIVTAPIVLGLYVAVVYVGYMLATHEGRTQTKLFWQPEIRSVESFTDAKMPSVGTDDDGEQSISFSEDMPLGRMRTYSILDEGERGLSIVRDGWLAFLARLKGGRAKIHNAEELRTRFTTYDAPWDEVFIIDPDADDLVEYEPPGLSLKTPEIEDWTDLVWPVGLLGGGAALAWQLASMYGPVGWTAIVIGVPLLVWKFAVVGTDSYVHIDPAPAAMRPTLATMLVGNIGARDAAKLEEAEEFAWRALASQDEQEMSWERHRDETFVDETFQNDSESTTAAASERDPLEPVNDDGDQPPAAADGGEEIDE